MSTALDEYKKLETKLRELREQDPTIVRAAEIDDLLEQLERIWWDLDDEERELLNAEPPQTWPEGQA